MEGPTSHSYFSQRLRLHYVDWGNADAPPLLLVHGGRDHCRNWDWVAQRLKNDYHIIAPDLRGHGDSQWVIGAGYNQVDYAYDLAQLIDQKDMKPLRIVAHSMGGAISLLYSGLFPENVERLVVIEGMGPPPSMLKQMQKMTTGERVKDWMSNLRNIAGRLPKRYETLEDAFQRMQSENPHLSADQARHLTIHGSNQNEDGTYSWKFDNYIRAFSPIGLPHGEQYKLWAEIRCPTLLVRGTESWASDPEEDGRIKHFRDTKPEVVNIAEAGHWVHHDQLDQFVDLISDFLA